MLNTRVIGKFLSKHDSELGIQQGNILSPFLFNVYMNPLDFFIDELKKQHCEKHELIPNPEFYKLQKQNRKEHFDKNFKTRIKLAKIFRDEAKKKGILRNLPRKSSINIYYVRYADDFLLSFDSTKHLAKKLSSQITTFIKSNLLLDCDENSKLSHGRSELVPFLGFNIGLYPFKYSTKSKHITRLRKLKAMVKSKKVQEASLYHKMVQSISSQFHRRILESCSREGQNLLKVSLIKKINDNRIKTRVVEALKRSLSDIELEVNLNPIGFKLMKSDEIKNNDSPFLIANQKRLNITRSIVQKWIVKAQELIIDDNLTEINEAVGNFLSPQLVTARNNFLNIINKLESKEFNEKALDHGVAKSKSVQDRRAILDRINTIDFPIRILLPNQELLKKLRNLGILHKVKTRPKGNSYLTTLKDHLIVN